MPNGAYTHVSMSLCNKKFIAARFAPPALPPGPILATNSRVKKFDCIHALKALGEESRMRIVRMILTKERSVNEIAEGLGMTQYNVSKHLRVLREAGLLDQQKQGQQRVYSLAS